MLETGKMFGCSGLIFLEDWGGGGGGGGGLP